MNEFYEQLQRATEEIKADVANDMEYGTGQTEGDFDMLADIAGEICLLDCIGRAEGLLALEEAAANDIEDEYLKRCIMLVVDGTDPELIEQMMLCAEMTSGDEGAERLRNLMSLKGTLMIQEGLNPRIIMETLASMIPAYLAPEDGRGYPVKDRWGDDEKAPDEWTPFIVACRAIESKRCFHREQLSDSAKKSLDSRAAGREETKDEFFAAPFPWKQGECGCVAATCLELMLSCMADAEVQKFLNSDRIDNDMFLLATRGVSGETRKRLWDNLPEGYGWGLCMDFKFGRAAHQGSVMGAMLRLAHIISEMAHCDRIALVKDGQDMAPVADAALAEADAAYASRFGLDGRTGKKIDPSEKKEDESEAMDRLRDVLIAHDAGDDRLI